MKKLVLLISIGVIVGVGAMVCFNTVMKKTSTNESCDACHVHPHVTESWKRSVHFNSKSGVMTNCVDCHLPPKNSSKHTIAKMELGIKDMWSYITKDSADFNWKQKSRLEHAIKYIPNESCVACHSNLFPARLTNDGITAHLYYEQNAEKLNIQCISCHLDVGHYDPNYSHKKMSGVPTIAVVGDILTEPTTVTEFKNFTEQIPGTPIKFNMVAIPEGTFKMGSPENEQFRKDDESPQRNVTLDKFFIAEIETTWNEFYAFYGETVSEGRTLPESVYENNSTFPEADAISGPTPPFGIADQGWGSGDRPAITMTHYAAETYCQWLSKKTGKKYRLPTEAEWEYVARAGSEEPFFFGGKPSKYSNEGFMRKLFSADTAKIATYFVYKNNSQDMSEEPTFVAANPFGVKNMQGNILEYCADKYDSTAYASTPLDVKNPISTNGTEHVVRGGSFKSDASELRAAARSKTQHLPWLRTDPQKPQSIWWYSDINCIGFRVVCEWED